MRSDNELTEVVFDFDGVIVDSNQEKRDCFRRVANIYGESVLARFEQYCGEHPNENRYQKMDWLEDELRKAGIDVSRQKLVEQYAHCVKAALTRSESVEELQSLKRSTPDVTWSIVSAAPADEIEWYLEQRDCLTLFEGGVYGAPRSKAKIFEEEYDRDELQSSVEFLGDSESDLEVAEEFGIDFVFVSEWSRDPQIAELDDVRCVESVRQYLDG